MTRYFFDINENGEARLDDVGTELEGLAQARIEAMEALPAIARDEIPKDGDRQVFIVRVRDEAGTPVYTATVSFEGVWLNDAAANLSRYA